MNLRSLDLNLLVVFDTVYALRSNTRAAEKLGLTQSAVSNALKRLREHLDDPLFQRDGQSFVPTARADQLAPSIRAALQTLEQSIGAEDGFDPVESDRCFTMMLPDAIEPVVLDRLAALITGKGLGIRVQTQPLAGADVRNGLLDKRLELGFLPNPLHEQALNSAYLFDEVACIIVRADHPVYGERDVFTLEDMSKVPLVGLIDDVRRHTNLEHELRARKIERNIVCTVSRLWSIPHLVANSDLAGAISRNMAQKVAGPLGLKVFDLPVERPTHHWHMIWHHDFDEDPGHAWLRGQVLSMV